MTLIKTYVPERPVNAVAMSPLLDHVRVNEALVLRVTVIMI